MDSEGFTVELMAHGSLDVIHGLKYKSSQCIFESVSLTIEKSTIKLICTGFNKIIADVLRM